MDKITRLEFKVNNIFNIGFTKEKNILSYIIIL